MSNNCSITRRPNTAGLVDLVDKFVVCQSVYCGLHHMLFLDGIYVDEADSSAQFRWVKGPTNSELTQLTHTIAQRLARYLEGQARARC